MADLLCERCRAEPGREFTFLYGTYAARTELHGGYSTTETKEELKGEDSAVIGDRCIQEHRRRATRNATISLLVSLAVVSVGAVLAFSGWSGDMEQDLQPLQLVGIFVGLAGLMGCLLSALLVLSARSTTVDESGEEVAIETHKEALERRGFNATYTHRIWQVKMKTAGH